MSSPSSCLTAKMELNSAINGVTHVSSKNRTENQSSLARQEHIYEWVRNLILGKNLNVLNLELKKKGAKLSMDISPV